MVFLLSKRYLSLAIIISSVLILSLLPMSGFIMYATPDDNMYLLITSGAYTGTPSPYTIFEGFLYSQLIACLYKNFGLFEWYSIAHYFLCILSFVTMMVFLLKSKIKMIEKLSLYVLSFLLQVYVLISPQNTLLAAELSLASIIILKFATYKWKYIWSLLFFAIGSEVRFEGAILVFLVGFPFCLFPIKSIWDTHFYKKLVVLSLFIAVSCCLKYCTILEYQQDEDWRYYNEYNSARGYINDNPSYKNGLNALSTDIEKLEYLLLAEYRVNDGTIIDASKLQECKKFLLSSRIDNIKSNLLSYFQLYKSLGFYCLFFLICLLFILSFQRRDISRLFLLISIITMAVVASLYLMSCTVAKERTVLPIFVIVVVVFMDILLMIEFRYKKVFVLSFILCFALIIFNKTRTVWQINRIEISKTAEVNNLLSQIQYNKVLIHNNVPISTEAFHSSQCPIGQKMVRAGWLINSPLTRIYYKNFTSLVNDLPMLVSNRELDRVLSMEILLKEYYGIETQSNVIAESDNYKILQLARK